MPNIEPNYQRAIKNAFAKGRRAGFWLAKTEPWNKEKRRRADMGIMRKQDQHMEGVSDMFIREEESAKRDALQKKKDAIRAGMLRTERGRAVLRKKGIIE